MWEGLSDELLHSPQAQQMPNLPTVEVGLGGWDKSMVLTQARGIITSHMHPFCSPTWIAFLLLLDLRINTVTQDMQTSKLWFAQTSVCKSSMVCPQTRVCLFQLSWLTSVNYESKSFLKEGKTMWPGRRESKRGTHVTKGFSGTFMPW